jgi:hypothetical protein
MYDACSRCCGRGVSFSACILEAILAWACDSVRLAWLWLCLDLDCGWGWGWGRGIQLTVDYAWTQPPLLVFVI